MPVLPNNETIPIRPYLLQQGFAGARDLAIRQGKWKCLAHKGSGGNKYETSPELKQNTLPDTAPTAAGQLCDLESDAGETKNRALEHPGIAKSMGNLLRQSIEACRSRPI